MQNEDSFPLEALRAHFKGRVIGCLEGPLGERYGFYFDAEKTAKDFLAFINAAYAGSQGFYQKPEVIDMLPLSPAGKEFARTKSREALKAALLSAEKKEPPHVRFFKVEVPVKGFRTADAFHAFKNHVISIRTPNGGEPALQWCKDQMEALRELSVITERMARPDKEAPTLQL